MKHGFWDSRRLLWACCGVLAVASMLPGGWVRIVTEPARGLVEAVVWPVARPIEAAGAWVRGPERAEGVAMEGGQWEQGWPYIARLEQELDEALRENQRLRQMLSVVGERGTVAKPVEARVSARGRGPAASLTIDRGSMHGLREGDAVVWGSSLVGRVSQVSARSAVVMLVTGLDEALWVRVLAASVEAEDRLEGGHVDQARVRDDGRGFVIEELGQGSGIEGGDLVHLYDDYWPAGAQGFIVGVVSVVEDDPSDPYNMERVEVDPGVSLRGLRRVMVLSEVEVE